MIDFQGDVVDNMEYLQAVIAALGPNIYLLYHFENENKE